MNDDALATYVKQLPMECIEKNTAEEIIFHLPTEGQKCPRCGSDDVVVNSYNRRLMRLAQVEGKVYLYNRKRLYCKNCRRTFAENAPFVAPYQRTGKNKLRQIRARKGITQAEVYKKVGIPQYLYLEYEAKDNPPMPPLQTALKIAKVLGVSVDELWDNT